MDDAEVVGWCKERILANAVPDYPSGPTFAEVNEFVHYHGQSYENLQNACLGLAKECDKLRRERDDDTAKELADLRAENLRLQKLMTGDPEEIEAHFTGNEGNVALRHWAVRLIAYSLWKTFEEDGGVNFLTMEVGGLSGKGPMEVTLRPLWDTKTPTQLLAEEKAKTVELEKELGLLRRRAVPCTATDADGTHAP